MLLLHWWEFTFSDNMQGQCGYLGVIMKDFNISIYKYNFYFRFKSYINTRLKKTHSGTVVFFTLFETAQGINIATLYYSNHRF